MQQPVNTFCHEARLPAPDRRLAFAGSSLDPHRADTVSTQQHDPSPPHMLLWTIPRSNNGFEALAITRPETDLNTSSHPNRLACPQAFGNRSSAPIH
jgi:hypothetical protein